MTNLFEHPDDGVSGAVTEPDRKMTRMQAFWSWLAVELGKRAGLVAIVGLLVTLVLGYGTTKLTFATGQDSYLNNEDQVYIDNVEYQKLFGGEAMLVLITADPGKSVVDVMSPANQAKLDKFAADLSAQPDLINNVITPKSALLWTNNLVLGADGNPLTAPAGQALANARAIDPTEAGKQARQDDLAKTVTRLNAIPADQRTLDNPAWVDLLLHDNTGAIRKATRAVYPDNTHTQIIVRLPGNASIETGGKASTLVEEAAANLKLDGATVTVTGSPVLLKQINDYLRGGMMTLGLIALAIMALILILLFDVRWRLLPLGVIVIGVIWAFGLAGYLGIPLSLVTIAGLPVMLGIGIDYAIQMHARVEEEVVIDRNPHPIQETARNLCPALLVVTFDAVFAFLALRFAKVPMIRQFGLLLAVGIAVICFTSIIVPLATLGIREYKSPTKGRDFREGRLGTLVVFLGSLPVWTAPVIAVASVAIFFGGLAVEEHLTLQTDPVQWVNQDSDAIKNLEKVQAQTGSSSELSMYVKSKDPFAPDTIKFLDDFATKELQDHPQELLTASSLVTTTDYITDLPGGSPVLPRPEDVRAAYEGAPPEIKKSLINTDNGAVNLTFRYGKGSLEERKEVVSQLRGDLTGTVKPPNGIEAVPSGLAVVGVGLLENLTSNRILLTYLALLFVGLFLAVRLRSITRSLLSLVPVLIAVGAASLVAFALSLKLSPMTAVGGPLVVAACTEFTSLILLRFIEERRRGLEPKAAVDVAAARTGRAFIVSGLTAISGVAVIAMSPLPLLRDFGIVVGMNVAVALLSALVVLPPLLVWADTYGWVSKRMIPDDVLIRTTPKYKGGKGYTGGIKAPNHNTPVEGAAAPVAGA